MSRPCGVGRSGLFVRCRRGAGSSAQATKSQERQVDALLAAWNRPGMPGAVVEVIRDGKVVLAKGYGSVDLERMMSLKAARPDEVVTLEDGLALLKRQRALNFTPGQQFLYSNSGYLLWGRSSSGCRACRWPSSRECTSSSRSG